MQIVKVSPGDVVRVRQRTWRVRDVRTYEDCALLSLAGIGASSGLERKLLTPFDAIEPIHRTRRVRVVTRQRWRHAFRALVATNVPVGGLRAAPGARIDLLPHQLEPALAIARGLGSRALIADDVGLGKTIQAGLVLSELKERRAADRALILSPAGLRDQWVGELASRFAVAATLVDSRELRQRRADLPIGANPWSTIETAVASFDFVKRADVLPSVTMCRWDIVIVDEAHNAAGDSDRHAACATLASRAPYVVLLTATPHNGERAAFLSLCDLGAHDDALLFFRRTRAEVGVGSGRRVRLLRVRPSATERRMHALVVRLNELVLRDAATADDVPWPALAVFNKRALSSAQSLQKTVERWLASTEPQPAGDAWQPGLLLFDSDGDLDSADEPPDVRIAFHHAREGRALLEEIAAAARTASHSGETKIAAIVRLLRRVREPAIVFTEYRDTLENLARHLPSPPAVLHGGLSRDERRSALDDFISGRRPALFATDAAGEGLNLHQTCRLVINLELPWNPMRLEQRLGRVDRIGQRRVVHAIHLVGRDTSEMDVLARLRVRVDRAKNDVGAADPLPPISERAFARMVIGDGGNRLARSPLLSSFEAEDSPPGRLSVTSLKAEAEAEQKRIAAARRLLARRPSVLPAPRPDEVWLTRARTPAMRMILGRRALLLYVVACEDGVGHTVEATLIPVLAGRQPDRRPPNTADGIAHADSAALPHVDAAAAAWRQEALCVAGRFVDRRMRRERAIAASCESLPHLIQRGLFDRRAERQEGVAREIASEAAAECARRIRQLEEASHLSVGAPRLLLVIA
jgi:superfamily II DNA or RNA helicase